MMKTIILAVEVTYDEDEVLIEELLFEVERMLFDESPWFEFNSVVVHTS